MKKSARDHLLEGLDYDLWATRAWLPIISQLGPNREHAGGVMDHIIYAQKLWLERAHEALGSECPTIPDGREAALEALTAGWKEIISSADLDVLVTWHRKFDGMDRTLSIGDLGWHISNHGTFHRGELRGLCKAEGFEAFFNTDVLFWSDPRQQPGRTVPL